MLLKSVLCCSLLLGANGSDIDLIISDAIVYDGSGTPARQVDVAIKSDRIVAVGDLSRRRAKRRIKAQGHVLAPGFIDLHSHSDRTIIRSGTNRNLNYLWQGATSVVTGNCGSGPVDVASYYAKIDKLGAGTNVLHLLPHGNLRREVMGIEKRPPAPKELARMKGLVDAAMRDGAWGMSTGLIYVPSSFSTTAELIALSEVVAQHGGIYVSHMRGEGTGLLRSVEETLRIGKQAKLPVHISHFKASGAASLGVGRRSDSTR